MTKDPVPGISRDQRISNEGLSRLKKHLELGNKISKQVLQQWIRRYGDDARDLLERYKYTAGD